MVVHLERRLRLNVAPKYTSLYSWAINEFDECGKSLGLDLIPWPWTLHFLATSCVLQDGFDFRLSDRGGPDHVVEPTFYESRSIRCQLKPISSVGSSMTPPMLSMFGTDRVIDSFEISIYPVSVSDKKEECRAWGMVAGTNEIDFRQVGHDDHIGFEIFVSERAFSRYCSILLRDHISEIIFMVNGVSGFYAQWSPSISADYLKVLCDVGEQKLLIPKEVDFELPSLGGVAGASFVIKNRIDFR